MSTGVVLLGPLSRFISNFGGLGVMAVWVIVWFVVAVIGVIAGRVMRRYEIDNTPKPIEYTAEQLENVRKYKEFVPRFAKEHIDADAAVAALLGKFNEKAAAFADKRGNQPEYKVYLYKDPMGFGDRTPIFPNLIDVFNKEAAKFTKPPCIPFGVDLDEAILGLLQNALRKVGQDKVAILMGDGGTPFTIITVVTW
jgi:hypothetical protein